MKKGLTPSKSKLLADLYAGYNIPLEAARVYENWLADSPEDALKGIREVVAEVVEDMKVNAEQIPEPIALKNYSGKFMVRIPPEVHRALAIKAAETGISLNRLASSKLGQ